ncbi:MAG: redox-regulated ATPase YchF [Candidatus ainarchaeum sp.]|nr:redox-regulated ATPase YchF [Candidatus ainarchaeum sp.]
MLVGIVGKPNVGKSTFFKALTMAKAEAANYPFTTIEPNKGVGFVRVECVDKELGVQCNPRVGYCKKGIRFVPVEVVDVAGLVPGAHEGKGLGNKFLDDLRKADALIHVVDIAGSVNEKGEPVAMGSYDPLKDIEFLEFELDMWIFGILEANWDKSGKTQAAKKMKIEDALAEMVSGLSIKRYHVEAVIKNYPKQMLEWNIDQKKTFVKNLRKLSKPIVIAANKVDLPTAENNIKRIKEKYPELLIVPVSAESELALKEADKAGLIDYLPGANGFEIKDESKLSEKQTKALNFIKTNILGKYGFTGVQEIMDKSVFNLLNYMAIFPGGVNKLADKDGNVLPDCFLLPPESTALDFAFHIHSDLGNKFIKAILVKTKMMVGKEHKLKNRDVIEIVSGR